MTANDSGLIVGLGNPGQEYERTRHNFGFMVVDQLIAKAQGQGVLSTLSGRKDPYELRRWNLPGRPAWFMAKPLTYMNLSGEAVRRIIDYYRLDPEKMLVVHDELDLPLGRLRLKKGGGNAGHKGLESIQQQLGTPDFYRLRLGIGKGADKGQATIAKVLGRFSPDEQARAEQVLDAALKAALLFIQEGPEAAVKYCNATSFIPKREPAPGRTDSEKDN